MSLNKSISHHRRSCGFCGKSDQISTATILDNFLSIDNKCVSFMNVVQTTLSIEVNAIFICTAAIKAYSKLKSILDN